MLDFFENITLENDNIPALASLRQKGKAAFKGLPTLKDEPYKYTNLQSALTPQMFSQKPHACSHEHCTCHEACLDFEAHEFHFCGGRLHEHFHFIEGLEISSLKEALSTHEATAYIGKFDLASFPLVALNTALLDEGLFIRISKPLDKPIALIYHNKEGNLANIRNLIVLEKGAKAEIIEIFKGTDTPYLTNIVSEIVIAKGASLLHCKLQNEGQSAIHIAFSNVLVKSEGKYQSYLLSKGAKLSRCETRVLLKEENAEATVNAAYCINDAQTADVTTNIAHLSPLSTSNQIIRGVMDDNAHGVFQGKIHIAPDAQKTEGHQQHKALLLSPTARVDVKPELEIFADDVKCSHGATSGDLNAEELFYLKSRGIDELQARKILTSAFLNTAFEEIENQNIKTFLENAL